MTQRAVAHFRRGQTDELPLLLASACLGAQCASEQRCAPGNGRCEEATTAQSEVRPFRGVDAAAAPDLGEVADARDDRGIDANRELDAIADRDAASVDGGLDVAPPMDAPGSRDVPTDSCPSGWVMCGDSCRDLATDPNHCGACNRTCSLPNASAICSSGCQIAACESGFGDCDRVVTNGCEADLRTDARRCGACGFSCALGAGSGCVAARCSHPSTLWVQQVGDDETGGGEIRVPSAFDIDQRGNHYVTGKFRGSVGFGPDALTAIGLENGYLVSATAAGSIRWARRFGFESPLYVTSLSTTPSDLVVLAGWSTGEVDFGGGTLGSGGFLAVYDASGSHRWSRTWPGVEIAKLAAGTDGSLYIAGTFTGTVNLGGGDLTTSLSAAAFVASVRSDGTYRWSRAVGSPESIAAIALDIANDLHVIGPHAGSQGLDVSTFTPDGADRSNRIVVMPTSRVTTTGLAISPTDGSMFIVGSASGTVAFGDNAVSLGDTTTGFIVALDASGTTRWARGYTQSGALNGIQISDVALTPTGIFAAGTYQSSVDLGGGLLAGSGVRSSGFVISLANDGSYRWSQRFGSFTTRQLLIATDSAGDVSLAGLCRGRTAGGAVLPGLETDVGGILATGREAMFLLRLHP